MTTIGKNYWASNNFDALALCRTFIFANFLIGFPYQGFWDLKCFSLHQYIILISKLCHLQFGDPYPFAPEPLQLLHHYYEYVRPYSLVRGKNRFSRSTSWPSLESCRLNTGCHVDSKQVTSTLVRIRTYKFFLTSVKISMLHQSVCFRSTF
jgi:hypothetical protein